MTTKITTCPIWGAEYEAEGYFDEASRTYHVEDSPRAGGGYVISQVELNASLPHLDEAAKARLTTWLIDQRLQGNAQPAINENVVQYVKNNAAIPVPERAYRLLKYLVNSSTTVGQRVTVGSDNPEVFAWSESID